jgi:membrane associated rhomboid family serine protease
MQIDDRRHEHGVVRFGEQGVGERIRWTAGWVVFALAAVYLDFYIAEYAMGPTPFPRLFLVYLPAAVGAGVVGTCLWVSRRSRKRYSIEFDEDGAWLPYSRFSVRRRRILYDEIVSLGWCFSGPLSRYYIGTDKLLGYSYKSAWFEDSAAIDRIEEMFREGVSRLPDGDRRLSELARRRAVSDAARRAPVRMTALIATSLLGVILYQWTSGSLGDRFVLLSQAPLVWWQFEEPGPFVVVSGMLLHAAWWHFAVNWLGFIMLGHLVEPILGPWRFVVVVLGGGLLSSLVALACYDTMAVGFSGALCAMLGALAALNVVKRSDLAVPYRTSWQLGVAFVLATVAASLVISGIGDLAHAAGLFFGLLIALLLMPSLDPLAPHRGLSRWIKAAAVLVAAIYLVAIGQWVRHLYTADVLDTLRVASAYWEHSRFDSDLAVGTAIWFVTQDGSTREDIELALDRVRRGYADLDTNSKLDPEVIHEGIVYLEDRLAKLDAKASDPPARGRPLEGKPVPD